MVALTLTNQNRTSDVSEVNINLSSGICVFPDKRQIKLKKFLTQTDFEHPLLTEMVNPSSSDFYHYEYDDIDGLLRTAIFVYATLLRVKKPQRCRFKINPSPNFKHTKITEQIFFSINSKKSAQESIRTYQLESIIHSMKGKKFNFSFSNDVIIDDQFTFEELPKSVHADELYNTHPEIITALKSPQNASRFELRYISIDIGLCVFSKESLEPGENLFLYTGIKTMHVPATMAYNYICPDDCLNLSLDAYHLGNMARFVNHAPNPNKKNSDHPTLLEANLKATYYVLNGICFVAYKTIKKILPGEQLLVSYGNKYFQHIPLIEFDAQGELINTNNTIYQKYFRKYLRKKWGLIPIRIMANHGVKAAKTYLLVRMGIITATITLLTGSINYFL